MPESILPPRSTSERETSLDLTTATRFDDALTPAVLGLGEKFTGAGPALLAEMIEEADLTLLYDYFSDTAALYQEGIKWQRLHGMVAAIHKGLAFAGTAGALEYNPTRRTFWNGWQIGLASRPDRSNLGKISRISEAGQPESRDLERLFHGYDIRPAESSYTRWGEALFSAHSGVKVAGSNPLWSLGRTFEYDHDLSEAELTPLGIWTQPTAPARWKDINLPWSQMNVKWSDLAGGQGATIMATALKNMGGYVGFYDPDGALIGARRFKAVHPVSVSRNSQSPTYKVLGTPLDPAPAGTRLYVEALTDFGNGQGKRAETAGVLFAATPNPGLPQGKGWLEPGDITAPHPPVGIKTIGVDLDDVTRERVKWAFSFV